MCSVLLSIVRTPLFSKEQAIYPSLLHLWNRPNMETMDEGAKSLILKGCKLARDLELRLESRPDTVANACEEIARAFRGATGRLARTCSSGGEAGQEEYCYGGRGIRSYECLATGPNTAVRSVQAEIGGRIFGVAVPSDSSRVSASSSLGEPSRYHRYLEKEPLLLSAVFRTNEVHWAPMLRELPKKIN